MKQFENQKGITLIELLATMTILLIIGGLFYGLLIQVFANLDRSETRITARQEANTIIAQLTTIHQKSSSFKIIYDNPNYFITETDSGARVKLGHPDYTYALTIKGKKLDVSTNKIDIDLKDPNNKNVYVELTLKNSNDTFTITTKLSRMTEAKTEGE